MSEEDLVAKLRDFKGILDELNTEYSGDWYPGARMDHWGRKEAYIKVAHKFSRMFPDIFTEEERKDLRQAAKRYKNSNSSDKILY